jgi:hypothetical protein
VDKQAIQSLRRLNQSNLEETYKRVFESPDGAIILEDLKGKFFEYYPTHDQLEAGQQGVLIYIKNMICPLPKDEDEPGRE